MPKHSDRKVEIYNAFKDSLERLREVLAEKETRITRDAAIHRFEFTVELAWKCIQDFLRGEEIICRSPKECLKSAFSYGLIKDDPRWVEMIEGFRNAGTHSPCPSGVLIRNPDPLPTSVIPAEARTHICHPATSVIPALSRNPSPLQTTAYKLQTAFCCVLFAII